MRLKYMLKCFAQAAFTEDHVKCNLMTCYYENRSILNKMYEAYNHKSKIKYVCFQKVYNKKGNLNLVQYHDRPKLHGTNVGLILPAETLPWASLN